MAAMPAGAGMPAGGGAPMLTPMPTAGAAAMPVAAAANPWTPMPGQGRFGAAGMFLAMWVVMMAAMMMPTLTPTLATYRRLASAAGQRPPGGLTVVAGTGYFAVWAAIGAGVFAAGTTVWWAHVRWPAIGRLAPLAAALVLLGAGCLQLTRWKGRQLARCRATSGSPAPGARGALAYGLEAGVSCARCCVGLMVILVVAGVMDLWIMAAVAAVITAERLGPWPAAAARAGGAVAILGGGVALVRAIGIG